MIRTRNQSDHMFYSVVQTMSKVFDLCTVHFVLFIIHTNKCTNNIQGASGGIVNNLGGGSKDYSE